jgi:ribonuclease D
MQGVIDLQLGVAFSGLGFSMGYAKLVESLFGESLDKTLTRSDWISRPLSDLQQRYAIDDVRFLKPIYDWQQDVLAERGLQQALAEESARFAADLASQDDPTRHYLKLRGGWPLSARQQRVLQALVSWREGECHRQDKPRNWVMADPLLLAIAELQPETLSALSNIQGLASGQVRRHGDTLLALIVKAEADDSAIELISAPLTRDQQSFYKQLKKHFVRAAETADIPIELLAPRKRLEAVVQQQQLANNPFFEGWRSQILAPVRSNIEELLA